MRVIVYITRFIDNHLTITSGGIHEPQGCGRVIGIRAQADQMSVPSKRYGRASMNIPKKTVARRLSLEPSSRNSLHRRILNQTITTRRSTPAR
jgi:hypothetical protein